ncbi:triose-phosphate isomerase [Porticoccus sp.]
MRRPLVAGNWKMHGSRESIASLVSGLLQINSVVDVAVFPPYVYLQQVIKALADTTVGVGAQNVSEQQQGAYTGEISADMLKDIGCHYVIVGHSERRTLYGESDQQVADKFIAAQSVGLVPILCVGETLAQREQGETLAVIARQLDAVTAVAGIEAVCKAVIAYEPVWAIGTGKTASTDQAQEVHQAIRQRLGAVAESTRLLYGGSVKAANAAELFAQPDIDGALVGGASLDSAEFGEICKLA